MPTILHIPHASKEIPQVYLKYFALSPTDLHTELLRMTDHFTDDLFKSDVPSIEFPVSRLLVDPERFEHDDEEPMSKVGMGCIYTLTHNQKKLKDVAEIRQKLLDEYYRPHHEKLTFLVENSLHKNGKALIIDCHSFPKFPLPYELDQKHDRAEICIGTDAFHTPKTLTLYLVELFSEAGFLVEVNRPFSGALVPTKFWQLNRSVQSVMIEVRRDLYMDEQSGLKTDNYTKIRQLLTKLTSESKNWQFEFENN